MKLFHRRSEGDLANAYLALREIEDVLQKQYRKVKERKVLEQEVELCRLIVENRLEQIGAVMEIVKKYSPQVAKGLKSQFGHFKKRSSKEFAELLTRYKDLPKDAEERLIRKLVKLKLDAADIQAKFAHIAFLAVTDTLQTTKQPFLQRKSALLLEKLGKINPKYARWYNAVWNDLESGNLDRSRQCAVTLRELLNGVISVKGKGQNRATKVTSILREQEDPKFVKAFVAFVEAISQFLGKAVHKEMNPKAIAFAVNMVEDILLFILNGVHTRSG